MANRYFVGATDEDWNDTGNWSDSSGGSGGSSVPGSSDDVFFDDESPSCEIDVAASCKSIDCTGYTATLTRANVLSVYGSITLSSSMTFTGDYGVIWRPASNSVTINAHGKEFYDFSIYPYNWSDNFALASDVTINHTFNVSNSNYPSTVSGAYSFICKGDVTHTNAATSYIRRYSETETTKILVSGSASQEIGNATQVIGFGLTVDVASTGGTVYFKGTINLGITTSGCIKRTSGAIDFTTNTSKIVMLVGSSSYPSLLSGLASYSFYDLDAYGNNQYWEIDSDITVTHQLIFSLNGRSYIKGSYNIHVTGDVVKTTSTSCGGLLAWGTTTPVLKFDGTGDQNFDANDADTADYLSCTIGILVAKSSGTLYFHDTIYLGFGLAISFTHTGGTLDFKTNSSTIVCINTVTFDTAAGTTADFNNLKLYASNYHNISLNDDIIVSGTFTIGMTSANSYADGSGKVIYCRGNIVGGSSSSTAYLYGTATLTIDGTADRTVTGFSSGSTYLGFAMNVTVNKGGGTLTLEGVIQFNNSMVLTVTAGTIDAGTSTALFNGNVTISANISFYNVTFYGTYTGTLSNHFTVTNTLDFKYANASGWTFNGTYKIYLSGNLTFSDTATYVNIGQGGTLTAIEFTGSAAQTITGGADSSHWPQISVPIIVNKSGGGVTVSGYLKISKNITFTDGGFDFGSSHFFFNYSSTNSITYTDGDLSASSAAIRFGASGSYTLTNAFLTALGSIASLEFYGIPTITLEHDLDVSGTVDFMYSNTTGVTLNGAYNLNVGGSITFSDSATYPNAPAGTATVVMNGTGTLNGGNLSFGLNLTIATAGTVTLANATFKFGKASFTPTFLVNSGTVVVTSGSKVQTLDNCNLNLGAAVLYDLQVSTAGTATMTGNVGVSNSCVIDSGRTLAIGSNVLTVSGNITNTGTLNCGTGGVVCDGDTTIANGVSFYDLTVTSGSALHLTSTKTYTVSHSFTAISAIGATTTIDATTPDSQAILTVNTAAIDVERVTATDIDSSAGSYVSDFKGTLDNATNWGTTLAPVTRGFAWAS